MTSVPPPGRLNLEGAAQLLGPAAQVRQSEARPRPGAPSVIPLPLSATCRVTSLPTLSVTTNLVAWACFPAWSGLAQYGQEMVGDVLGDGGVDGAIEDDFGT